MRFNQRSQQEKQLLTLSMLIFGGILLYSQLDNIRNQVYGWELDRATAVCNKAWIHDVSITYKIDETYKCITKIWESEGFLPTIDAMLDKCIKEDTRDKQVACLEEEKDEAYLLLYKQCLEEIMIDWAAKCVVEESIVIKYLKGTRNEEDI